MLREDQLEQAEKRLAEVAALEKTIRGLRSELSRYHAVLNRKLERLAQATPPPPAPPVQDIVAELNASEEVEPDASEEVEPAASEEVDPQPYEEPALSSEPVEEEGEPGSERRTAARRKGNPVQLRITRTDTGDLTEGWVVDRSSGGVRILLDQAVPIKTVLNVRPVKAVTNFPWIKTEVRSCQPERGGYSLGCMFLQKLNWGELQAFG